MIITISRGTFSGGLKLAELVSDKLGYRCVSREILLKASSEYGVSEQKLFQALTQKPWVLERLTKERKRYLTFIRAAVLAEVKDEKVVYHGHAGHLLLKDVPHILRVRVIANMEIRIKAAMEQNCFIRKDAIEYIKRVDKERAKWTKFLYHVDWNDSLLYDAVFHIDLISLEYISDIICRLANNIENQATRKSQKVIDDLAFGNHLKALITADKSISNGSVEVTADGSLVTIAGTVGSIADADKVRTLIRNTPGVEEVDSKMRVRLPTWYFDN